MQRVMAAAVLAAALGGCALPPVQPWEKGDLARPEMGFGAARLESAYADHVHESREAAAGGASVGGGGCGCY